MSIDRESLYRSALALAVGVIGFLIFHIVAMDAAARQDAAAIVTQEAHIARLRVLLQKHGTPGEFSVQRHPGNTRDATDPKLPRLSIVAQGR